MEGRANVLRALGVHADLALWLAAALEKAIESNRGKSQQENDLGCLLEIGWEAGIRTPITCSRGRCPTVGRPPSVLVRPPWKDWLGAKP